MTWCCWAIIALSTYTTKLFAKCPETVSFKTADPMLSEAFSHNGWQVVCHDERLSAGHHGRQIQGFMLNRTALNNSTLNEGRMEDLIHLIAGFCCFGEMAIGKNRMGAEAFKDKYPGFHVKPDENDVRHASPLDQPANSQWDLLRHICIVSRHQC